MWSIAVGTSFFMLEKVHSFVENLEIRVYRPTNKLGNEHLANTHIHQTVSKYNALAKLFATTTAIANRNFGTQIQCL